MRDYTTVLQYTLHTEINRSKFITFALPINEENEAKAEIEKLRARYKDATHVCSGYYIDAGHMRFDDDGEPEGTAGRPILEAIRNNGLERVLVVIVRYFGGIKLGAGGLIRAYSGCADAALKAAEKKTMRYCTVYELDCSFGTYNKVLSYINGIGCVYSQASYGESVTVTGAFASTLERVQAECIEALGARIVSITKKYV